MTRPATKYCAKCDDDKPLTAFSKQSRAKDGKATYCKTCYGKMTKRWARANRARRNQNNLLSKLQKLGLSFDAYEEMFEVQEGKCAICMKPETKRDGRSGELIKLAIDHDHDAGQVRRLLCSNCNTGLGLFKDNPELLETAAAYLRQFQQSTVCATA